MWDLLCDTQLEKCAGKLESADLGSMEKILSTTEEDLCAAGLRPIVASKLHDAIRKKVAQVERIWHEIFADRPAIIKVGCEGSVWCE